jgi:cytochrome P450
MDFANVNLYTEDSLVEDPYPYFEWIREQGNVWRAPFEGVVAVVGYDEIWEIDRDPSHFSSVTAPVGPFPPLPFTPDGDDIREQVEHFRDQMPMKEHFITYDPPQHTAHRGLLMRLLTPKRLKENEEFMWRLADHQLEEFLADGRCEFIGQYSQPFALLVIADLLGVPEQDHQQFVHRLATQHPGAMEAAKQRQNSSTMRGSNPLEFLDEYFAKYVEDRRRQPTDDVLTAMAEARFPDGSAPEVADVVHGATFLFGAGQETTARLLATAMLFLAEDLELQERLRQDRSRIPDFLEETLRIDGPIKTIHRLCVQTTTVGGVEIKAGTHVMLIPAAANRDPRHFANPDKFDMDRSNVREQIGFGRGVHSCVGGPLARAEARISLERILDRMGDVRLSEEHHGLSDRPHFNWAPTYILRGLIDLHLEFSALE